MGYHSGAQVVGSYCISMHISGSTNYILAGPQQYALRAQWYVLVTRTVRTQRADCVSRVFITEFCTVIVWKQIPEHVEGLGS